MIMFRIQHIYFSLLVYGRKEYLQHLLLVEDPMIPAVALVKVLQNIWKNQS